MARHVALLRAVNVGGVKVPMAALRELAQGLGFADVSTHLNSGNLLLTSDDDAATVGTRLEAALAERFGREVPVLVRSRAELEDALARVPFRAARYERSRIQIAFLTAPAAADAAKRLGPFANEEWAFDGREAFLYYPDGMGRSKLTNAALERAAGARSTVRGVRTVEGLIERL